MTLVSLRQQRSPQRTIKLTTPLPPLSTSHGASNFLAPQDKHAIGFRQNPKASNTSQDVSRLRKAFFTRRVISFSAGSLEVRPDSAHIFVLFFVYSLVACLSTCLFLRSYVSTRFRNGLLSSHQLSKFPDLSARPRRTSFYSMSFSTATKTSSDSRHLCCSMSPNDLITWISTTWIHTKHSNFHNSLVI